MSTPCIFCNVSFENLVFKNDEGMVILDDPVRPGHVLIGARSHGESLSDISEEDAATMMKLANRTAKYIVDALGAEKVYVAAIGDKDKHFHVHLLPKLPGDPNLGPCIFGAEGWIKFLPPKPSDSEVARISTMLKDKLSAV